MAASIIEPATGASTWAFGSHKWKPYTGIFIRKAITESDHHIVRESVVLLDFQTSSSLGIDKENLEKYRKISLINNGREPKRV